MARALACTATPGGKVTVGRSRTPVRSTGPTRDRLITATPAVVPQPSRRIAPSAIEAGSSLPDVTIWPKTRKTVMTTTLLSSGASAAARKRRWACSTPVRTTPSP